MERKIKNIYNQLISVQQAILIDEYSIEYFENGIIQKIEYYEDGDMYDIQVYNNNNENESEFVTNTFKSYSHLNEITIAYRTILANGFCIDTEKTYMIDGTFLFLYKNLYDRDGECICQQVYDIQTNLPIFERTIKQYYNRTIDPEVEIFRSNFNEDGSLSEIHYDIFSYQDDEYFHNTPDDLARLSRLTGLTIEQLEYFVIPDILPPPTF